MALNSASSLWIVDAKMTKEATQIEKLFKLLGELFKNMKMDQ
jgi:hypothetical protein